MIIDLTKLITQNIYEIPVSGEINVPKEYLDGTEIRKISTIKVNGFISYDGETYNLNVEISGIMTLGCARTLKDVERPFVIKIDEIIDENNDNSLKIIQNRVDIFSIIWENVLVDVPLRVLHPSADNMLTEGDGWKLTSEEEKKETIDPRLAKLGEYFKE